MNWFCIVFTCLDLGAAIPNISTLVSEMLVKRKSLLIGCQAVVLCLVLRITY